MQRKFALALSLAFTTIVTFAIIVVGAQAGFFNGHKAAKADQVSAEPPAQSDTANAGAAGPQAAVDNQAPLVVTDYIYIDQTPVPIRVRGTRAASGAPTPLPQGVTAQPKAQPASADATRRADSSQTATPGAGNTAVAPPLPTATPPTSPAAPTPTLPAPTPSPQPAATQPPQPRPTSAPALAGEIEFVGTVTAISGNMATFAYGTTTTAVRVSQPVSTGARFHVHARLQGGVYVATELEGD